MSKDRERLEAVGMVEGEAVANPAAAVVPGEPEALEAERRHRPDHVGRARALAVGGVLRVRGRLAAVAVAAEVRADHGVAPGQRRRDAMPHDVGLRVAVQEQERRPGAADPHVDRGLAGRDVAPLEAFEHARSPCCCAATCGLNWGSSPDWTVTRLKPKKRPFAEHR
jgi:hypothetical protein